MIYTEITIAILTLLAGLMAGFFFAYTFSVNSGLGKLNDIAYLSAMQKINRAVLNPIFYLCFLGPLLLLPIATIQQYNVNNLRFICLIVASIAYIVGVFFITGIKNVPLNNKLDSLDLSTASAQLIAEMRSEFEKPWTFWNNIRTIAATITLGVLIIVCIDFPFILVK